MLVAQLAPSRPAARKVLRQMAAASDRAKHSIVGHDGVFIESTRFFLYVVIRGVTEH